VSVCDFVGFIVNEWDIDHDNDGVVDEESEGVRDIVLVIEGVNEVDSENVGVREGVGVVECDREGDGVGGGVGEDVFVAVPVSVHV
jgi:hypothetical protein